MRCWRGEGESGKEGGECADMDDRKYRDEHCDVVSFNDGKLTD